MNSENPLLQTIESAGYHDLSLICKTENFFLYSGTSQDKKSVLIKLPNSPAHSKCIEIYSQEKEVQVDDKVAESLGTVFLELEKIQQTISGNAHVESNENKFRNLVDNIQSAIVVHGADTKILMSNPMAQELLGLNKEQLQGKSAIDKAWKFLNEDGNAMPPGDYPVNRVLAMGSRLQNYVVGIERPDRDNITWVLVNAVPAFNEMNKISQVIVSFSDISERKRSEQQLIANERLFRTLVENSPDNIARYDLDLKRIYINPALQKQFSQPVKKLIGKNSKETESPLLNPDRYMSNIQRAIDTGEDCSDELAYRNIEGDIHWASMRFAPEFNSDGKVISVIVISNDITQKKQAELEHKNYLSLLKNLDRINQVLQQEGDLALVFKNIMDEVLDIFGCDRAFLLYPCDPFSTNYTVPIESTKPDFPGASELGMELTIDDFMSNLMGNLLDSAHPIQLGANSTHRIPDILRNTYSIRSFLVMALFPKVDKAWIFGIHQCSYERVWTEQEVLLLEEIGYRMSDGLNSLLITRNLRQSEERFRQFFENSPLPIREEDFSAVKHYLEELKPEYGDNLKEYLQGNTKVLQKCANLLRVIDMNSTAIKFHEVETKNELLGNLPGIFPPESMIAFPLVLSSLMQGETSFYQEGTIHTHTGRKQNVVGYFSVMPGYEQSLGKVLVSLVDITERKQAEDSLRLAASVFANSQEGIMITDIHNRIIDINPAFTCLTGYSRDEIIGKNPNVLSAGKHSREFYAAMWQSINEKGGWIGEIWNKTKSGKVFAEQLSVVAVKNDSGKLQHYVGAFTDITTLKQHEADLERIAYYDVLTSIPNRRLFEERVERAIARARRQNRNLAICYLDLDGFKPINDDFGHEAGDFVLIEIARRLQLISRADDTVARLGGDEFVLLWNQIDSEIDCVQALERVLQKISEPIMYKGNQLAVSASIGVTLFPDDAVDADSLLRNADHAMYSAKHLGKNRYQMFDAQLERQITARMSYIDKVSHALDDMQFELYYQPKVECISGKLEGVEALIRWNDPILGLVGPKEFLPLIENENLALSVGRWVMGESIRQAKTWNSAGITMPISINIFPRHMKNRCFAEDLNMAIQSHWPDMPKNRLQLEIVESSAFEDLEQAEQVIKKCLSMGVVFSLDDFGTGYSSLVYLQRLSISELKIDQSFVRDMLEDKSDQSIVVSVIGLGRAFGLRVVAEGVETATHIRCLKELGCSIVQGYALGRPMKAIDLEVWYKNFFENGI